MPQISYKAPFLLWTRAHESRELHWSPSASCSTCILEEAAWPVSASIKLVKPLNLHRRLSKEERYLEIWNIVMQHGKTWLTYHFWPIAQWTARLHQRKCWNGAQCCSIANTGKPPSLNNSINRYRRWILWTQSVGVFCIAWWKIVKINICISQVPYDP